jgi:RIO kinase 1
VRPQPEWLIPDDVEYTETELGTLKSGKEAEVSLIERTDGDRSILLAHKRYRPRTVTTKGELAALGFQRANTFMNDSTYRDGRKFAKSRDQRASERMTNYGKSLLTKRWTGHELDIMTRAWAAGVNVPYPVGPRGDGLLMEFIGDDTGAAPRLADTRLQPSERERALEQVVENLRLLVGAGFVHSDLSAFNLLWWQDQVWLIDFPQAVDMTQNPHALDYLLRDVTNIGTWFARQGVSVDTDSLYTDLVMIACAR